MAGTISTGVFPVNNITFEVNTSTTETEEFVSIADMENANISIETGVETWYSITDGGWQKALATAKALTIDMSGKRCIGDAGNDFIASKWNKNGQECNADFKITFPNGDTLTFEGIIQITSMWGGDATNVAGLEFTILCNGEPMYTTV